MRRLLMTAVCVAAVVLVAVPVRAAEALESPVTHLGLDGDFTSEPAASLPSQGHCDNPLGPVFAAAAVEYRVPLELLLVLGQIGSGFEDRGAVPTVEWGYGVMALRRNKMGGDSLDLAAALTGIDSEDLKTDPAANVRGAAAVLDEYAREERIDRQAGIEAWLPVVIRYAGLDDESSRLFARTVFSLLGRGISTSNSRGEAFSISARWIEIDIDALVPPTLLPEVSPASCGNPDYAPAIWTPAASCNYSTTNSDKDTVIIHVAEGSAAGTISWFRNCSSGVSTQYVVDLDGTVYQMVCEKHIAFHGNAANNRSIGLEHAGYTGDTSHPEAMYVGSAACVRDMCDRWGIAKEKRRQPPGIIGHIDVTECLLSGSHTDPGRGWDWGHYIALVNQTSDPTTFVVESRPGGKNYAHYSEVGSFSDSAVKSNLWDTTAGIGHRLAYSTGGHEAIYRYTPAVTGTYRVFAAWPTSTNASRVVEHVVTHAGGSASIVLDTNADSNPCGRNNWNLLGEFTLTAGVEYRVTQTDATHRDSLVMRCDAVKWERVSASSGNPPTITLHPQPQTVAPGATTTFTVAATGEGTISYRWRKDGANLNDGGHYFGVTTTTLTVSNVDADDVGLYRCAVTNEYGTTLSNEAMLSLQSTGPTEFIVESRSGGQNYANYSETGSWSSSTAKSTAPGVTAGIGSRLAYISTAGQDAIFSFTSSTTGLYEMFVTGPLSTNTPTSAHHIISHADGSTDVHVDQNNNSNAGYSTRWNSLGQYTLDAGGTYTVTITTTGSTAGTGSTALRADAVRWLFISGSVIPPTITQHPVAQNVCLGGAATFTVQATGESTLSYQWQKNQADLTNGPRLAGVTSATLHISPFELEDAGEYRCVVTGDGGSVISNNAALTVAAPPAIVSAVSRKVHGQAGPFDINVSQPTAIESRQSGPTEVIVTFDRLFQLLTGASADVQTSQGTVTSLAPAGHELAVELENAGGPGAVTLSFPGIADAGNASAVATEILCFRVLQADATNDGQVNIFDLVAIRNTLNQPVDAGNFTRDINVDGVINVFDLVATRNRLNTAAMDCP